MAYGSSLALRQSAREIESTRTLLFCLLAWLFFFRYFLRSGWRFNTFLSWLCSCRSLLYVDLCPCESDYDLHISSKN